MLLLIFLICLKKLISSLAHLLPSSTPTSIGNPRQFRVFSAQSFSECCVFPTAAQEWQAQSSRQSGTSCSWGLLGTGRVATPRGKGIWRSLVRGKWLYTPPAHGHFAVSTGRSWRPVWHMEGAPAGRGKRQPHTSGPPRAGSARPKLTSRVWATHSVCMPCREKTRRKELGQKSPQEYS